MYAAGKHPRFDLTRVPIGRHGNRQNHLRRTMDEQGRPCRTHTQRRQALPLLR